jgi:hypothetical protein
MFPIKYYSSVTSRPGLQLAYRWLLQKFGMWAHVFSLKQVQYSLCRLKATETCRSAGTRSARQIHLCFLDEPSTVSIFVLSRNFHRFSTWTSGDIVNFCHWVLWKCGYISLAFIYFSQNHAGKRGSTSNKSTEALCSQPRQNCHRLRRNFSAHQQGLLGQP